MALIDRIRVLCNRHGQRCNSPIFSTLLRTLTIKVLDIDTPVVSLAEAHRFISDCMIAVCTPKNFAKILADNLVLADYAGHYSHGMNRLAMYVKDVQDGQCNCTAKPSILKETDATAWVTGNNGLGAVVGQFCMDLAVKKAKDNGIGLVVAKESNHFGIAGVYSRQAIKENVIGMSFSNTSPLMAPTRAKEAALGTNPLTLGAPGENKDSFVLDMATTAVALGKIEIQKRKGEPLPDSWALDEHGKTATDANVAYKAGRLMPLGGSETHSGYKGYGLAMMVEILCGILAGSSYGPYVRKWGDSNEMANLGQAFIAIDPICFAPGFQERLQDLLCHLRGMEPADLNMPVMVAGDSERLHMASVDEVGGVRYVQNQHDTCKKLAIELNVPPLKC